MRLKLFLTSVFAILGGLLAAGYCAIAATSWQAFVNYDGTLGTDVRGTLERYIKSLPKGKTGHGISFLGMPIEEEYDWGSLRPKEYHGLPGGQRTFIALGALTGGLFYWLCYQCFKRRAITPLQDAGA